MPRHCIAGLRKDDCPRQRWIGSSVPKLAVDEDTDSTRTEAQWHQRYNKVGNPQKRLPSFAREQRHRNDHSDDAAVRGHTAFPDGENIQRMLEVIRQRSIEQHMAEAA